MLEKRLEIKVMKSFPTSSKKTRYKVNYYVDTIFKDEKVEYAVIEIPTNDVVEVFTFKEDAEEMAQSLTKIRPFGREPLPRFLKSVT
tara:strand:+ start:2443 stop:2703 length:261 start_codon:yes stop_codon:yes gene_type:complete